MCFYGTSEALQTFKKKLDLSLAEHVPVVTQLDSRLYLTTNAHRNLNPKHSKYVPVYSKPAESYYF